MAKLVLDSITSGYAAVDKLNTNFQRIEEALENTLSRDGTAPNTMLADMDINGKRILNLPDALVNNEPATLGQVKSYLADNSLSDGYISQLIEEMVASAGQTVFVLSDFTFVPNSRSIRVYVNGLLQDDVAAYAETNTATITFTEGLQAGDVVRVLKNSSENSITDGAIRNQLLSNAGGNSTDMIGVVSLAEGLTDAATFSVESYAAVRAYSGPLKTLYVRGHTAALDGGSGIFRVDESDFASADNGGTVLIDAGSQRWKREYHGAVNVKWFGAIGDGVADDTVAIEAAAATGRAVYIPAGTYLAVVDTLPSGSHLFGDGVSSVLKPLTADSRGAITINSASSVTFIDDLTFRDLKFLGTVSTNGFSEQKHLLTLNGVRNCLVDRCWFVGFRGDGLYLGSGDVGGQEKHNHNVTIRNCHFDGVNNDNRQGISVVDCDGLLIEGCKFENCTRSNMPGAIDIEPDVAAFHVIKNIKIVGNYFKNVGGNLGVISMFLNGATIPAPYNIQVSGNEFNESVTSTAHAEIFLGTVRALADSDGDMRITISNNKGKTGSRPLDIRAVKGVNVFDNSFENYLLGSYCGQAVANQAPRNVVLRDNRFVRCASSGGVGLEVFAVDYLTLENNLFDDCGSGAAGSYAIGFNTGTSSNVALRNNLYRAPTAKMVQGIIKEAAHTFTASTNTQIGDRFLNSLSNAFEAEESDIYESSYTPVVEGATTVGTGTYNAQTGRFMRRGKIVRFWAHVDVQAGHTGTGQIEVSLPLPAKSQAQVIPVSVLSAEGVANAERTAIGVLNTGATANSVQGAIRMFANANGAGQTQLTIPAGAFKLWVSGEYVTT